MSTKAAESAQKNIRVCILVSYLNRAASFEWIAQHMDRNRFELEFLLLNPGPSDLEDYFQKRNVRVRTICLKSRRSFPSAFFRIFFHLVKTRPHAVHTHLIDASLLGMIASWFARIPVRIVTRHHSTFHHGVGRHWVLIDKLISALSTHLIATTQLVYDTLVIKEDAPKEKVRVIHHGFDLSTFDGVTPERVSALKLKYGYSAKSPVVGVISRLMAWKGVVHIVRGFRKLLNEFPNAVLVLANASGPELETISKELSVLPEGSFHILPFVADFPTLFKSFDVFVHAPINEHAEAFGQVYVEALAAEVPSVFTMSGICHEIVKHGKNAVVAKYEDPDSICAGIRSILNREVDVAVLKANGRKTAEQFALQPMIDKLEALYSSGN